MLNICSLELHLNSCWQFMRKPKICRIKSAHPTWNLRISLGSCQNTIGEAKSKRSPPNIPAQTHMRIAIHIHTDAHQVAEKHFQCPRIKYISKYYTRKKKRMLAFIIKFYCWMDIINVMPFSFVHMLSANGLLIMVNFKTVLRINKNIRLAQVAFLCVTLALFTSSYYIFALVV